MCFSFPPSTFFKLEENGIKVLLINTNSRSSAGYFESSICVDMIILTVWSTDQQHQHHQENC